MKQIPILIIFLVLSGTINSQSFAPATKEQQQMMLSKISEASAKMKSLKCNFVQEKELSMLEDKMVSKGAMHFRHDNRLRWEYLTPYTFTFMLNDNKLLMQAENSRNVVDIKSNRFFQEIVKIMMSSINGSGLIDAGNFEAKYYWSEKSWNVVLTPVQKEIKRMFSSIELLFNTNDYTVDRVTLAEQSGDTTIITLSDKQFNAEIEDNIFNIN